MDSQLLFLGVRTEQYMLYKDRHLCLDIDLPLSAIQRRPVR